MADAYVAEIRIFGFNLPGGGAPKGWAQCNGQIMPISQNTALFSLLGTTYGGNGTTNFALPNLQGRVAIQQGQGQGLSQRLLGSTGGEAAVALNTQQLPSHNHGAEGSVTSSGSSGPAGQTWRAGLKGGDSLYAAPQQPSLTPMGPTALSFTGGGVAHNNWPPYLVLNYCIALQGDFPPRQ